MIPAMDQMFDFATARGIVLRSAPATDQNRKFAMALAMPFVKVHATGCRMLL